MSRSIRIINRGRLQRSGWSLGIVVTSLTALAIVFYTAIPLYHKVESLQPQTTSFSERPLEKARQYLLSSYRKQGQFPTALPPSVLMDTWGYPIEYDSQIHLSQYKAAHTTVRHLDRNFERLPLNTVPHVSLTERGFDHQQGTSDDVKVLVYPNWQEFALDTNVRFALLESDLSRLQTSAGEGLLSLKNKYPNEISQYYFQDLFGRDLTWQINAAGEGSFVSGGPDGNINTTIDNIRTLAAVPLRFQVLWPRKHAFRSGHDADFDLYLRFPFTEQQFAEMVPSLERTTTFGENISSTEKWLGHFNSTFPGNFRKKNVQML